MRDSRLLQTYEFLHATFGEYLVARMTVQLAAGLLTQRPALAVGTVRFDDDLLYALLSWAPLSSRQLLRFVRGCATRDLPDADLPRLTAALVDLHGVASARQEHRHQGYLPRPLDTSARHGIYTANLVLMLLVLNPSIPASRLFPGRSETRAAAGTAGRCSGAWLSTSRRGQSSPWP